MNIPQDKLEHFILGQVSGLIGLHIGNHNIIACIASAVLVGFFKEVFDAIDNHFSRKKGKPVQHSVEFLDFFATALGGVFCAIIRL